MGILKILAMLGLLIICSKTEETIDLLYGKIERETENKLIDETSKLLMSSPTESGYTLSIFISVIYQTFNLIRDLDKKNESETESSIKRKIHSQFNKLFSRIDKETDNYLVQLPNLIGDEIIDNDFKDKISFFKVSTKNIRCMERNCPKKIREPIIKEMLNPLSKFRMELAKFVPMYLGSYSQLYFEEILQNHVNIFDTLVQKHKSKVNSNLYCDHTQSMQTKISKFSTFLLTLIIQSYSMVVFAHILEFQSSKDNNATDLEIWEEYGMQVMNDFHSDVLFMATESQRALSEVSRDILRCDRKVRIRGKNYERLTHFLQAQLYMQQDLNECQSYYIRSHETELEDQKNKIQLKCNKFTSIKEIYISRNNPERLYHHFGMHLELKFLDLISVVDIEDVYGHKNGKNLIRQEFKLLCGIHYCFNDEKEDQNSVRRINLDTVSTSPNYVVTGIRWIFKNRILHLQVQQGLLKNGILDSSSINFIDISETPAEVAVLDMNHRKMSLDDVILPSGYFVTKVKMSLEKEIIVLEVGGQKLDPTGKELTNEWEYAYPNLNLERSMININGESPPGYAPKLTNNVILSKSGKHYVEFGPSSMINDAGQTALPYFDIQPILTDPPSPIGGIGTYFRGSPGYSGYVALKIVSIDVMHLMDVEEIDKFFTTINELVNDGTFLDSNK